MASNDLQSSQSNECPICMESLTLPCKLPCGHIFCFLCIKGTLNISPRCSLCRRDISTDYINNVKFKFEFELNLNVKFFIFSLIWLLLLLHLIVLMSLFGSTKEIVDGGNTTKEQATSLNLNSMQMSTNLKYKSQIKRMKLIY